MGALSLVKLGVKVAVPGAALVWSVQQGVWGSAEEGSQAAKRLSAAIGPAPDILSKVPIVTSDSSVVDNWNTGMKTLFEGAAQIPELTKEYSKKSIATVSDLVK